jgi:hypothetical protein
MIRLIFCFFSLIFLTGCQLQDSYGGKIVLAGNQVLQARHTLDGDWVAFGGESLLASGSFLTGSLHILGGKVIASGRIDGNVTLLAGELVLLPGAEIGGDCNVGGGKLAGLENVRVQGKATYSPELGKQNNQPGGIDSAGWWVTTFFKIPFLALVAFLVQRNFPLQVSQIEAAGTRYLLVSAAQGSLAWAVGLSLIVLMTYTILLIPVSLLGFGLMLAGTTLGVIPYARILGNLLCTWFRWKLNLSQEAAAGMILLACFVEVLRLIPVFGTLPVLFMFVSVLGAVLLTRFGTRGFVVDSSNSL